jgi:IS30 family transposase
MPGSRLTLQQREIIARGVELGLSLKAIAVMAGCSAATVCRELARERADTPGPRGRRRRRRGGGRSRLYRPERAHAAAVERGRLPKPCRLTGALGAVVAGWLEADWSPEQISAMLRVAYPSDEAMRVSHETIYQSLFVQTRGELRRELAVHLRTGRTARRPRKAADAPRRGRLVGMVSISQRPAEADDSAVPGHWESQCSCQAVFSSAVAGST